MSIKCLNYIGNYLSICFLCYHNTFFSKSFFCSISKMPLRKVVNDPECYARNRVRFPLKTKKYVLSRNICFEFIFLASIIWSWLQVQSVFMTTGKQNQDVHDNQDPRCVSRCKLTLIFMYPATCIWCKRMGYVKNKLFPTKINEASAVDK